MTFPTEAQLERYAPAGSTLRIERMPQDDAYALHVKLADGREARELISGAEMDAAVHAVRSLFIKATKAALLQLRVDEPPA